MTHLWLIVNNDSIKDWARAWTQTKIFLCLNYLGVWTLIQIIDPNVDHTSFERRNVRMTWKYVTPHKSEFITPGIRWTWEIIQFHLPRNHASFWKWKVLLCYIILVSFQISRISIFTARLQLSSGQFSVHFRPPNRSLWVDLSMNPRTGSRNQKL